MTQLLIALAVFLALHSIPALPAVRNGAIALLGRRTYLGLYSAVSVVVLAWVFHAALNADYVELWEPAAWQAHVTLLAAPVGLFLVIAGLLGSNPASISFRGTDEFSAITAVTRHPVLWGFMFWSFGHVVANGDLRSLVLFGGLGVFSFAGLFLLDRRGRRRLGNRWPQIATTTSIIPFAAILAGRTRLRVDRPLISALLLSALVTFWLLAGGHLALFGADPMSAIGS